jgi:hypothetical protein
MAYDILSGTIVLPGELLSDGQVSASIFQGDGQDIYNIPRITSNPSTDNLLTVGADANSLVGEPNLTFNGSALTVAGQVTASAGVSASIFYGDASGLTNIPASGISAEGPNYSLQYRDPDGDLTGSANLLYSGSTVTLTGALNVSGALTMEGDLVPAAADVYDLGTASKPWRDLYISGSSIHFGSEVLSVSNNNLKFGSGSTTKGFDVGFMNLKNNGIFMDEGHLFKLRAYQIQMFGGVGYVRRVVADDYTIREIDYLIGIQSNTLTASVTLTLPAASGLLNGQTYIIKDEGGAANTHAVTITTTGDDVIDGTNEVTLNSPYASIQLYCNGAGKFFIT